MNGSHPGCIRVASLLEPAPLLVNITEVDKNDVGLIQFSSGTTGFPKGVEITHYGLSRYMGIFK